MHPNRDFETHQALPFLTRDVIQDLGLGAIFDTMASEDGIIREVVERAMLEPLTEVNDIRYRQAILDDVIHQADAIGDLYAVTKDTLDQRKHHMFFGMASRYPSSVLQESVAMMTMLVGMLRRLRSLGTRYRLSFHSEGFRAFFERLEDELSDDYLRTVESHLKELGGHPGVWLSAQVGIGFLGDTYVLHRVPFDAKSWVGRLLGNRPSGMRFQIADRDEAGARALSTLEGRGINEVANALAQSCDHVLGFFVQLQRELAFYLGCSHLIAALAERGQEVCWPQPLPKDQLALDFRDLRPLGLCLAMPEGVVGNDLGADDKGLILVTGANQGGKSTFLKSLGVAQLLMQCGMCVPAQAFRANLVSSVYTHFIREEDKALEHGKLDEELQRLSEMIDNLGPHALVLFNESFAATNDREGSALAHDIVCALCESQIKVVFVTHLEALAHTLYRERLSTHLFLRADRQSDGQRSYKMIEAPPLYTSFAQDLFREVFGTELGDSRGV